MIDFKNKKVRWICIGSAAGIIIIAITVLLLVNRSNIKAAEKAEKDRIAQEEQAKKDLEALTIKEASASTNVAAETPAQTETPASTQPTKTTTPKTTTPTPVVTPTPTPPETPTPDPGPQVLVIIVKDYGTGKELTKNNYGAYTGYYDAGTDSSFVLNYTPIAGTTLKATVEFGEAFIGKVDDVTYYFKELAETVIRLDLIDSTGKVVATGKAKLTTGR